MLIKFESSQSSSFVMQESTAKAILKLMDRDTPEGAVTEKEIQDALNRLESAFERLAHANKREDTTATDMEENEQLDAPVDLHARAVPLLDMLRRADKENGYVMWRPD